MTTRFLKSALLILLLAGSLRAQKADALLKTLQATPPRDGWEVSGAAEYYDAADVERFSPDLAPALRLYGVRTVAVQNWTSGTAGTRSAGTTLFEMADSTAAYGLFTLMRDPAAEATPTVIGAASFQSREGLYFWQSNYLVKVDARGGANDAGPETLARLLSENIRGRSRKPPVSAHLPPGQLVEGTDRYLLSAEAIDTKAAGLKPEQLGFDVSAEAATATYRTPGGSAKLLLLLFPTQHLAKKYADEIELEATAPAAFRKRVGPLVGIVFGSRDETAAQSILDGMNYESVVTWNERNPDLALGTMIVTIFTFIGIALLFTLVVGISYGGLRIFVKAKYPNQVFDRPQDMEIIQLNLIQGFTRKELHD